MQKGAARLFKYGKIVVVALVALAWASAPARADKATDAAACIALFGGPAGAAAATLAKGETGLEAFKQAVGDAKKAAEASGRFTAAGCGLHAEDPLFQALAVAMTALVVKGDLGPEYKDAHDQVQLQLAKLVAKLLDTIVNNPDSPLHSLVSVLGPEATPKVKDMLADGAGEKIMDLLDKNELVKQILNYVDCAVIVATSGIKEQIQQAINKAKETAQSVQDCTKFAETCVKALSDCATGMAELGVAVAKGIARLPGAAYAAAKKAMESTKEAAVAIASSPAKAGEYVQCHIAGSNCGMTGGSSQMDQCVAHAVCDPGRSLAICNLKMASTKLSANCQVDYACGGGSKMVKLFPGPSGNYCSCPADQGFVLSDYYAACTPCSGDGKLLQNGFCRIWTCAAEKPGLELVSYGKTPGACNYKHSCADGSVMSGEQCTRCGANQYATYTDASNKNNQLAGFCQTCAWNETSKPGSTKCEPLKCTGLTHTDKNSPHMCVACKDVATIGGKKMCQDAAANPIARPKCPPGQSPGPNGTCKETPKTQGPAVTKRDGGPVMAPSLDNIGGGGGFSAGSTAPAAGAAAKTGGGVTGTPALPSSTPTPPPPTTFDPTRVNRR